MSLQEITQGVTRVHTNVKKKKTRAVIEQVLYFNTIEDSVYCIEMYEAFFFFRGIPVLFIYSTHSLLIYV